MMHYFILCFCYLRMLHDVTSSSPQAPKKLMKLLINSSQAQKNPLFPWTWEFMAGELHDNLDFPEIFREFRNSPPFYEEIFHHSWHHKHLNHRKWQSCTLPLQPKHRVATVHHLFCYHAFLHLWRCCPPSAVELMNHRSDGAKTLVDHEISTTASSTGEPRISTVSWHYGTWKSSTRKGRNIYETPEFLGFQP